MEDILKRSQDNQDQMSSRVTALLAGSSLTTTAGVRIERRDTIDQIDYTAVGEQILHIFFLDLIFFLPQFMQVLTQYKTSQSRRQVFKSGSTLYRLSIFLFFFDPNVLRSSPSFTEELRLGFSHSDMRMVKSKNKEQNPLNPLNAPFCPISHFFVPNRPSFDEGT